VVEHLWIFGSKSHFIMMCAVTHVPWWSKEFQNFWIQRSATKFSDRFDINFFSEVEFRNYLPSIETRHIIATMVVVKRSSKELDINVRHSASLTGNDRQRMRVLRGILHRLHILRLEYDAVNDLIGAGVVRRYIIATFQRYDAVATVAEAHPIIYHGDRYRFDSPDLQPGMIAATYRFKSIIQLQRLRDGLQIPERIVNPLDRCRYNGEEVLLLVLERCAQGTRLVDMQMKYRRNHAALGKTIHFFCRWLQERWGYLIHDNLDFWKPYLRESSDAIALKLRDYYPDIEIDLDDFFVTGFLDCVIFATCIPGGGPMEDGPDAPPFPDHVQRAFYNNWAKKHGMKKQASCLANGMAMDVGKGFSCRRNDLHLLRESDLNMRMTALTADLPPEDKFQLYGDSAYVVMQSVTSAADEDIKPGMNACRECI
jgi:hypothetical protein